MTSDSIKELIRRRRGQMLLHSCLYYELDSPVISDHQWQDWANELEKLQNDNPDCKKIGYFDWEFRDWSGTTGAHLNHRHPVVYAKAKRLIELEKMYGKK